MRKIIVVLLFAFMLLMMAWVYLTQSVTILQRLANVSQVQGQVTYVRKGQPTPIPLTENNKVKEGDVVQTGPESTALLTWVDGSKVHIAPNSQLEVKKCSTSKDQEVTLFNLNSGEVWARIAKRLRRESRFEIQTPSAIAGVRGTIFSLSITPSGGTRLSVFDGSVVLESARINRTFLRHMILEIEPDGKAYDSTMTEQEQAQWQQREDFLGPLLAVSAPKEGDTLPAGPTKVTGSTEPGASVLVNGTRAAINRLGRFSAPVSLAPGDNIIEISATDRFTFSTVIRRQVIATPVSTPQS